MKKIILQSEKNGFTLLEVLVAITVLMFAIVGPLTLAFRSINYTNVARDQTVATYLAQDALEFVIAKKIYNVENNPIDWLDGIAFADSSNLSCGKSGSNPQSTCTINTDVADFSNADSDLKGCNADASDCVISYNSALNLYKHESATGFNETQFSRYITVSQADPSNPRDYEAKVQVTVKWNTGIIPKEFNLTTYLYNQKF